MRRPGEYGGYLPPRDVIHWMIDTVSKNGTFILNVPGKPDGTIDSKEIAVLDGITAWMQVNGEAIYETRPWKVYGEGPSTRSRPERSRETALPRWTRRHPLHAQQGQYGCLRNCVGMADGTGCGEGAWNRGRHQPRKDRSC